MTPELTVIVTDVASPGRFVSCLTAVHRTVGSDVRVVGMSARFPRLPAALDRRVRKVQLHRDESMPAAVAAQTPAGAQVVVLTSDTRVSDGWLEDLRVLSAPHPDCVSALGAADDPHVLVFGPRRPADPRHVQLAPIPSISWPARDTAAPTRSAAPTISAGLIVKNEEDVLEACLVAVRPEVDEVVVYDTGSTDRTVAIAEAAGARVVQGYWDDDFGAARNRMLEHCVSEWVLTLDADEVVDTVAGSLRASLVGEPADVLTVPVVSTSWSAADDGSEHRSGRIFRRSRVRYEGALHETLVSAGPEPLRMSNRVAPLRLIHSGYQPDRMQIKGKSDRNLAIAQAQVDAITRSTSQEDQAGAWSNYGRALVSAGRRSEGLAALNNMLGLDAPLSSRIQGGRVAMIVAITTGEVATFDEWLALLRDSGEAEGAIHLWRARREILDGRLDDAERSLELARASGGSDPWGVPFDQHEVTTTRAELLVRRGQADSALEVLRSVLRVREEAVGLEQLVRVCAAAEVPLAEAVPTDAPQFISRSLREAVQLSPQSADLWLQAVWQCTADPRVLVAAAVVAPGLPLERVLTWSLRLRERGMADLCPLRSIGRDDSRSAHERCLALGILIDVLHEAELVEVFDSVADTLTDDETGPLLDELAVYAPGLVLEPTAAG